MNSGMIRALTAGCLVLGVGIAVTKGIVGGPPPRSASMAYAPERSGVAKARVRAKTPQGDSRGGPTWGTPPSPEESKRRREVYRATGEAQIVAREALRKGDYLGAEVAAVKSIAAAPRFGQEVNGQIRWQGTMDLGARQLLGEAYLGQGRNREALECFLHQPVGSNGESSDRTTLNLGAALALSRLGEYRRALGYYSPRSVLDYAHTLTEADLPPSTSPRYLEAAILYSRGCEAFMTSENDIAARELAAAHRLMPRNAAIALHYGWVLGRVGRHDEAMPLFAIAATYGSPAIVEDARTPLRGLPPEKNQALLQRAKTSPQ